MMLFRAGTLVLPCAVLLLLFQSGIYAAESGLPDLGEPLHLAAADTDGNSGEGAQSEQCLAMENKLRLVDIYTAPAMFISKPY